MRTLRKLAPLVLALLLGAAGADVVAAPTSAEAALGRLQAWLDGTRDLHGGFSQELVSGALGAGLAETGEFYLERPGRMRWEYRMQSKIALIVDGETSLYLAEDRQWIRGRLDVESSLLPRLLAGDGRLGEWFRPSLEEPFEGANPRGALFLGLAPLDAEDNFERVVLELRARDGAVRAAEVQDAVGNRMLYRFRDVERNAGLAPGLFGFEPPPGTTVLDDR